MPPPLSTQPGSICQPDARKGTHLPAHAIADPSHDSELQAVHAWLVAQPVADLLQTAVDDAVQYVLDGARTWRFNLLDPKVDSDERSSVGTKLQYHVIDQLGLKKVPPLDTEIAGVAVEIKGTVRNETAPWMIPKEGQCQVTMLIQIDPHKHRFAVWLMRTHRAWLNGGKGNQDQKRSPLVDPFRAYSLPLVPWTELPSQPLNLLDFAQLEVVFGTLGLKKRAVALFTYLPNVVIPRSSLVTVGAGLRDPMKRLREAKEPLRADRDLIVLVGKWVDERESALAFGHVIGPEDWVAVPRKLFTETGTKVPPLRIRD